jgi:hypothetical protein
MAMGFWRGAPKKILARSAKKISGARSAFFF